jgi:hypothetical protein
MHLRNETRWPAMLQQADFGTPTRYAVVISKQTYLRQPDGALAPVEDPMPITGDPVETSYGTLNGDIFLRKEGADLCVLGSVRRKRKHAELAVTVACQQFRHTLRVSGDRAWLPTADKRKLVPSAPVPFDEMELSYRRAYGGVARAEGMEAPNPDNPIGRGYHTTRDEAVGKLLPNIESAAARPIRAWEDRPAPAGWGPYFMSWGLRASDAVKADPKTGTLLSISPKVFNNAHPELVLRQIDPGSRIVLDGVRDQPWTVDLPRALGRVSVVVGLQTFEATSRIDGVFVWLDTDRVVVTQRANFRYAFEREQVRGATLTEVNG